MQHTKGMLMNFILSILAVLILSVVIALVSPFYFWEAWVSLGILTISAWLIHWRTRANPSQPQLIPPVRELRIFLGVPILMIGVGLLLSPFNIDRTAYIIIVLVMLALELGAATGMLWRHRHNLVHAWLLLVPASLWSTSIYLLVSGRMPLACC
jgi:O-antigen/teichoic acid export membrane protein